MLFLKSRALSEISSGARDPYILQLLIGGDFFPKSLPIKAVILSGAHVELDLLQSDRREVERSRECQSLPRQLQGVSTMIAIPRYARDFRKKTRD
jgi:hypothetical protein